VALGLVLAAAWAYGNSLGAVLVLDDIRAIVDNQTIRTLHPITTPLSPPTGTTVAGRPVGNLTFALNYAAAPAAVREAFDPGPAAVSPERASFERNILGYRLLNVAIHLAAALTLFGVLRRTFLTERVGERLATAAPWLAAAIALLWLVHPLQTSAVSYLVQRVESLMGLFYLLALYCAIRAGESLRRGAWSAAAIAASALGMATKEVMVTAPIAVAVWNWVFGGEEDRPRRWPLVGGLAATWLVLAALLAGEQRAPSIALGVTTTWQYLLTQSAVIAHYLRLVVWPSPLVFLYTWPLAQSAAEVIPQVLLIGALLGITAYGLRRRHPLAFAGVWFFLVLAPTSSVLPIVTEVAAEHRMYLPLAAVITCAVLALHTVAGRLTSGTGAADRRDRSGGLLLTCGAAVVLAVVRGTSTTRAPSACGARRWPLSPTTLGRRSPTARRWRGRGVCPQPKPRTRRPCASRPPTWWRSCAWGPSRPRSAGTTMPSPPWSARSPSTATIPMRAGRSVGCTPCAASPRARCLTSRPSSPHTRTTCPC
jgi:hypothetical protein